MTAFLIRRAFTMVLVALVVSVLVFALARAQGDPRYMYLSEYMTQEQWDELGVHLGLDRPVLIQYFNWLGNALKGDLGTSLRESRPVWDSISERIPATFQLAVAAWTFSVLVGWPLGVLSAVKRGTMMDSRAGASPCSDRPFRDSGLASCLSSCLLSNSSGFRRRAGKVGNIS